MKRKNDMEIIFFGIKLEIIEERVFLTSFNGMRVGANSETGVRGKQPFSKVRLASEIYKTDGEYCIRKAEEWLSLRYIGHSVCGNVLIVTERSERIEVITKMIAFENCNAIAIEKTIKNISNRVLKLEEAATLILNGVGGGVDESKFTYFYKFVQSHHVECQPRKISLFDFGFFRSFSGYAKKLSFTNIGSWSTKEELPQGIVENSRNGECLMFQIESNHDWHYELSVAGNDFYLALYGNSSLNHRYCRMLQPDESYRLARAAFCFGSGINSVIEEMTAYRRQIAGRTAADEHLPVIFNEYMHLSWDSPHEEKTKKYARTIANAGAEYYVIDCGWHDDMEDGVWVYPYMGKWEESKKNFPHGLRATTDYIRSLGIKPGLWIEPEIVGVKCKEMLDYYDDDCFLKRNGERICVSDKFILNFRKEKVRTYLSESLRRMIEDYGAEYVKMDYNVDSWFVDGDFEAERKAYLDWVDELHIRFPNVLIETCSSGGMRMDYETLKHFSIVSTSDQTRDWLYPYIAGNILSAILPEQAAVWSYPVSGFNEIPTREQVQSEISLEKIALNMVNSMLGRIHLSSDLSLLSNEQFDLVKQGVAYTKKLNEFKRKAIPYFPLGFTDFSQETVACGLKFGKKLHLAVWVLRGNTKAIVPLQNAKKVYLSYPLTLPTEFSLADDCMTVNFNQTNSARFFEIDF